MGRIGNFGKLIVFETSDSRILNFTDYQRTIKHSTKSQKQCNREEWRNWSSETMP